MCSSDLRLLVICHLEFELATVMDYAEIATVMDSAVDMQGFKNHGNDFVLKELGFVSLNDNDVPAVLHFKPSFPWRRLTDKYKCENLWLELCYHGLPWNSCGTILKLGKFFKMHLKMLKEFF